MWHWHRTRPAAAPDAATARAGLAHTPDPGVGAPVVLSGSLLFATRGADGSVGLDCLLEAKGSPIGVPVHCVWEMPRDTGLAALQLRLVESWLREDKPVRVSLQVKPHGCRLMLSCADTRLVVDAP